MKIQNYLDILNEQNDVKNIKLELMKFFKENPKPEDSKIHSLAEKFGIEPDELEKVIYSILGSFFGAGRALEREGKFEVDPKELEMGIKVELEHTNCPLIAERIAMDHLAEISDYYTRLKKMESDTG